MVVKCNTDEKDLFHQFLPCGNSGSCDLSNIFMEKLDLHTVFIISLAITKVSEIPNRKKIVNLCNIYIK